VRKALRQLRGRALTALKAAGVFGMVRRSRWRGRRLLILCYHGISLRDEHEHHPELYVRPELFAARLEALARGGYTVLRLPEAVERLQADALPPRSVCLTFDDGMHNFSAAAQPVLERFGYPATVYLSTYYCIHDEPVFNPLCSYLLRRARGRVVDARASLGMDEVWDLRTTESLGRAFLTVQEAVNRQGWDGRAKTAFARRIAEVLGFEFDGLLTNRVFHLLRPDQVVDLARRGVDFQLHTHRHRSPLDRELYLREIRQNREHLKSMLGTSPVHFCYPSGYWRPEFLPWLREAGVASATTTAAGLAAPGANPLLLPRLLDSEQVAQVEFEAWLTGTMTWLRRPHRNGHGAP